MKRYAKINFVHEYTIIYEPRVSTKVYKLVIMFCIHKKIITV